MVPRLLAVAFLGAAARTVFTPLLCATPGS